MSEAALPSSPAPSWLARLARRPAASLLLLCLVVWLPGALVLPPLDRDESRFAQASKQMVETGDFVDIRLGSGTRYNKPIGIYWLQSASARLLGFGNDGRIWTYRIPSLVGGYVALLLVFWMTRAIAPPPTALAAAGLLGASVAMTAETQIATTDAVLLATILGAQAVLMRIYLADRDTAYERPALGLLIGGWFAFAAGILVKGPVIVGVLGVTVLALVLWDRDWRWLKSTRPLLGLAITAVVVLPWMIAIQIQSRGAFYRQSLGHDFANKIMSGQESHGAPPGYFLALATLTLWPAILFVLPGLREALTRRSEPAMRYLLAWAGASWLMFELVPTKLPHYILPAYPALAILAALWALAPKDGSDGWARALRVVAGIQFIVGLIAIPLVAIEAPVKFGTGMVLWIAAIAGVGAAIGISALAFYFRGRRSWALAASVAASMVLVPLLTAGAAPRLDALWISPRTAALVAKDRRPGDPSAVVAGYAEPSLIFLLGTRTQIVGDGADAARIAAGQGGLALIEDRERDAFLAELGALDTQAFAVDALDGYDYSRGRKMHITIYRVAAAAQMPAAE